MMDAYAYGRMSHSRAKTKEANRVFHAVNRARGAVRVYTEARGADFDALTTADLQERTKSLIADLQAYYLHLAEVRQYERDGE